MSEWVTVPNRMLAATAAALFAALVGCTTPPEPKLPPPTTLPKPPAVASAAPSLGTALKVSADADQEAGRARESLARASAGLTDIADAWKVATAEVDRLRKQKSAGEAELIALYDQMVAQEQRNKALAVSMADAADALKNERSLRETVTLRLRDAEQLTLKKDSEVEELRRLLEYSEGLSKTYAKQSADAQTALTKAQADVSAQKGKIRIMFYIILGMGSVILLAVGWWALKKQLIPWR